MSSALGYFFLSLGSVLCNKGKVKNKMKKRKRLVGLCLGERSVSLVLAGMSAGIGRMLFCGSIVDLISCWLGIRVVVLLVILLVQNSAARKVRGQTPKRTKYGTFQDAPTLEYLIALLFSKILKIRCYLEFNIP